MNMWFSDPRIIAIASGVGRRTLVSVGLSATQSRHARIGSRTGEEWTPWFSEPAKNKLGLQKQGATIPNHELPKHPAIPRTQCL